MLTAKIDYCDTETTGKDPDTCGLVQVGMIIEENGREIDRQSWRMRPHEGSVIEPEAFEINGLSEAEVATYPDPFGVWRDMQTYLERYVSPYDKKDKFQFCGFNGRFDMRVLQRFWQQSDLENGGIYFGSYFNWRVLDPLDDIARLMAHGLINLPNNKLATVCDHFGVPLDNAHEAMADVIATRQLFHLLTDKYFKES